MTANRTMKIFCEEHGPILEYTAPGSDLLLGQAYLSAVPIEGATSITVHYKNIHSKCKGCANITKYIISLLSHQLAKSNKVLKL